MSLVHLAHVCSHLQNASLARLGLTSIPHSRMHLMLSVELQKQGFLSTVVLGGQSPPQKLLPSTQEDRELLFEGAEAPDLTDEAPSPAAHDQDFPLNELFPHENLRENFQGSLRKQYVYPERVTQENRATRRLWLGLKYWDGEPVLRKMKMLSKPTQRLWLNHSDLSKIARGKRSNYVDGLTRVGECLFVSTDKGVMEAREAMERRIGGMALCRAWG